MILIKYRQETIVHHNKMSKKSFSMYEMNNVDFYELIYVEAKSYSNVNFNVFSKNLYSKIINLLNNNFLAFLAAVSVIGLVCLAFTSLTLHRHHLNLPTNI